ncbi:uncharacterized protein Dvar_11500 [Desulfosarcina variabilis str. Montpellier]|uniref:hypothetical protein n=1 Tax=Desulfosarcina variabilis TaxID=2300 RepID=UPI003AFAF117
MRKYQLIVAKNENTDSQKCPICGRTDRPETPWWFFDYPDIEKPLCFNCIADRAPKLLGAIMAANQESRSIAEQVEHEDVMLERTMRQTSRDVRLDLDKNFSFK